MTPDQIQPGKTYKQHGGKARRRVVSVERGIVTWYAHRGPLVRHPVSEFANWAERESVYPLKPRYIKRRAADLCAELGIKAFRSYKAHSAARIVTRTVIETRKKWVVYTTAGDSKLCKIMTAQRFHNELVKETPQC